MCYNSNWKYSPSMRSFAFVCETDLKTFFEISLQLWPCHNHVNDHMTMNGRLFDTFFKFYQILIGLPVLAMRRLEEVRGSAFGAGLFTPNPLCYTASLVPFMAVGRNCRLGVTVLKTIKNNASN